MPYYHLYELNHAALAPMRAMADMTKLYFKNPFNPISATPFGRSMAAACELFERTTRRYGKPEFGLDETVVDGVRTPVRESIVWERPFCRLIRFERMRATSKRQPSVLVVAPMSGHYATLLRGTVEALLPDHDVYITDWIDARMVPISEGLFDLDDYVDYIISMMHFMKGDVHIMAVCQPSVPVLAAVATMEADGNPYVPHSMTLMGGPIDTRVSPTAVNQLAESKGIDWFRRNVIMKVPPPHPGFLRDVYPGFLQLSGFMGMNLDRHLSAHHDFYNHLIEGDGDSAEKHREFYDEYLAVMDLTAEFYLQTVDTVFIRHALPKGEMMHRDRPVDPSEIRRVALFTVEGEKDDISGVGQTKAAQTLCTNIPDALRAHYVQSGVGHYGVFNGSRYRSEIAPRIADFIATHDGKRMAEKGTAKASSAPGEASKSASSKPAAAKPAATKPRASKPATSKPAAGAKTTPAASIPIADDLTRISGIGPKIAALLNDAGIVSFTQLAELSDDEIGSLEDRLKFKGRVTRENWVEQARSLATH